MIESISNRAMMTALPNTPDHDSNDSDEDVQMNPHDTVIFDAEVLQVLEKMEKRSTGAKQSKKRKIRDDLDEIFDELD